MSFTIVVIDDDVQYHGFIAHILQPASDITIVGYASNGIEGRCYDVWAEMWPSCGRP